VSFWCLQNADICVSFQNIPTIKADLTNFDNDLERHISVNYLVMLCQWTEWFTCWINIVFILYQQSCSFSLTVWCLTTHMWVVPHL